MAKVKDTAAYILSSNGPMTTTKLQRLCYYAQGWSMAWDGVPLFGEEIQAWANGPVIYELFVAHRGKFVLSDGDIEGNPAQLSASAKETIDAVLKTYGDWTTMQLSYKSHLEPPWVEARSGLGRTDLSRVPISLDAIQGYFTDLADTAAR